MREEEGEREFGNHIFFYFHFFILLMEIKEISCISL